MSIGATPSWATRGPRHPVVEGVAPPGTIPPLVPRSPVGERNPLPAPSATPTPLRAARGNVGTSAGTLLPD